MINEIGENLNIIVNCQTLEDWQAFSTWYSIYKNLPDSKVILACTRNNQMPFQLFQWAKRLNIPHFYQNPNEPFLDKIRATIVAQEKFGFSGKILILNAATMVTEPLDGTTLTLFNRDDFDLILNDDLCFLNNQTKEQLIDIWNSYGLAELAQKVIKETLCFDANSKTDGCCFSSFKKGCGKWIDSKKGCPFSSAAGMVADDMTVNELRIIELWKKMVPLYSTVL